MEVSIIIPLFNRLDLTRACLESLERTLSRWRYEVIIVDDGSTDGTRDFLRTLPAPRYRVVLNQQSLGYAANNNLGARLARASLLCLLNNDTVLRRGWLPPMARVANLLPGVAFVGNVQREPISGLIDHYGVYFDHVHMPQHAGRHTATAPAEDYLEWPAVTAACCVVRRRTFLKLGGFDEAYRNGFEDTDLCLRAHERGYRHFVANRSEIYHHVSSSPGRSEHEDENVRRLRARWYDRLAGNLYLRRTVATERAEARRYLRQHLGQPWRYTARQLWRAGRQVVAPSFSRQLPALPRTLFRWEDALRAGTKSRSAKLAPPSTTPVFLIAGHTARNPACDGVSTVVRKLAGALGRLRAPVRLVQWQPETRTLCLLPPEFSLGQEAEPLRESPEAWKRQASRPSLFDSTIAYPESLFTQATFLHELPPVDRPPPGSWIVLPEVPPAHSTADLVEYVHQHGWQLAVVLHDVIATNEPQLFPPGAANTHALYLRAISGADLVLPVSDFTAQDWRLFTENKSLSQPPATVCKLAADTFSSPRVTTPPPRVPGAPVKILCVATVTPRKGQDTLLAAYERALAARPDLPLELRFVGARRDPDGIGENALHAALWRYPDRVFWHERVEYSTLRRFYESCDFTVYPSVLEGFGLPILESLWCRRPCVCANFGAMDETAWGGGCVVTDVRDPQALAETILSLAPSPERLAALGAEIDARWLRCWEEYARDLLAALASVGEPRPPVKFT